MRIILMLSRVLISSADVNPQVVVGFRFRSYGSKHPFPNPPYHDITLQTLKEWGILSKIETAINLDSSKSLTCYLKPLMVNKFTVDDHDVFIPLEGCGTAGVTQPIPPELKNEAIDAIRVGLEELEHLKSNR